jgi:hypothetical protein
LPELRHCVSAAASDNVAEYRSLDINTWFHQLTTAAFAGS